MHIETMSRTLCQNTICNSDNKIYVEWLKINSFGGQLHRNNILNVEYFIGETLK
jgi:hypothetical protein